MIYWQGVILDPQYNWLLVLVHSGYYTAYLYDDLRFIYFRYPFTLSYSPLLSLGKTENLEKNRVMLNIVQYNK